MIKRVRRSGSRHRNGLLRDLALTSECWLVRNAGSWGQDSLEAARHDVEAEGAKVIVLPTDGVDGARSGQNRAGVTRDRISGLSLKIIAYKSNPKNIPLDSVFSTPRNR